MNVQILRRLDNVEATIKENKRNVPDLVFIEYHKDKGNYHIMEDFFAYEGKPKKIKTGAGRRKEQDVKELHDYILSADFNGTIFLEGFEGDEIDPLIIRPEDLKEIKKQPGKCFVFESINGNGAEVSIIN